MSSVTPLSSTSAHLENLNPPQLEAVKHFTGPILVLAGAGSGKTRVLTRRVANLVLEHRVNPRNILAVTFTNKATEEMRERLLQLLGQDADYLWVATFHSAGLRMLRHNSHLLGYKPGFVVYDEQDSKNVLKQVLKDQGINEKQHGLDQFSRFIDQAKNSFKNPQQLLRSADDPIEALNAQVYQAYQLALMASNAMDFGDLLFNAVRLLKEHPQVLNFYRNYLHFILVDEYQDTNEVQYEFVKLLSEPRNNILVVGDDDQSIYAFRGATIKNILEFEHDFPNTKVIKLEQNYRSTGNILELANSVIENNKKRKEKKLWTDSGKGSLVHTKRALDEGDEAQFVAREIKRAVTSGLKYKDVAIFYRTNAQSRAIEEALSLSGIPYRIFGGLKFYDRKEVKDILGYLKIISNPQDTQAFLRVVNNPTRGIGTQTIQMVIYETGQAALTIIEAARRVAERNKSLAGFMYLYDELTGIAKSKMPSELINAVVEKTGYVQRMREGKDPAAESRIENLLELCAIAKKIEHGAESPETALKSFLDRVALTSGADLPNEGGKPAITNQENKDAVNLMTLHLAKGLEFPMVFLTGMEEGLIPHYRSFEDPVGLEEERRLCYVGITRAKKDLYLTRAEQRGMFSAAGGAMFRDVSRFVEEMKAECLEDLNGDFAGISLSDFEDSTEEKEADETFNSYDSKSKYGWQNKEKQYSGPSKVTWMPKMSHAKKTLQNKLARTASLIKTADSLGKPNNKTSEDLKPVGPLAAVNELVQGTRVRHPSFGSGIIQSLEPDPRGDEKKLKLLVKFDNTTEPKKLVYRFAKLSLAS